LHVTARLNRGNQTVALEYQSGKTTHAACLITFGDPQKWLQRWTHDRHLVEARIASLRAATQSGQASTITNRLAYRLFANLVDYSPRYQRMHQVNLDSEALEAIALVTLDKQEERKPGFAFSPYNLDGLLHLSGLVLNGNETFDHREAVFISHRWESLRLAKPLRADGGKYRVYVKMIPTDKSMMTGNVHVICDGEVVGVCEGIRFQRVPRKVLDLLLPPKPKGTPAMVAEEQMKASRSSGTTYHMRKASQMMSLPSKTPPPVPRKAKARLSQHLIQTTTPKPSSPPQSNKCLEILASEIGLTPSEISPSDRLADLGVDSLMSLALAGRLEIDCGINVTHATIMECETIGDFLDIACGESMEKKGSPPRHVDSPMEDRDSSESSCSSGEATPDLPTPAESTSSLEDGAAGSSEAYDGLICPLISAPESHSPSLSDLVTIYLRTVLSLQPTGPYYLGGWSVGGVLAFEAAKQLAHLHGERVESLLLIDAPCPLLLPPMGRELIDFLDRLGLFDPFDKGRNRLAASGREMEKRGKVLRHFDATVRALGQYRPEPCLTSVRSLLVWAREGVLDGKDKTVEASQFRSDPTAAWILSQRGELSTSGWERLLPQAEVDIVSVSGNHFSMMTGENVSNFLHGRT
jgi:thioesterase domain-containing protein/acyl carrier protein